MIGLNGACLTKPPIKFYIPYICSRFHAYLQHLCSLFSSISDTPPPVGQTPRDRVTSEHWTSETALSFDIYLQWQAGVRRHSAPTSFEPRTDDWGYNWLERWMAVRPWENRFLKISSKDGETALDEQGPAEGKVSTRTQQLKQAGRQRVSTTHSGVRTQSLGPSHSDGPCASSSRKSTGSKGTSAVASESVKAMMASDGGVDRAADLKVSGRGSQIDQRSNPKEKRVQRNPQPRRRLSLPSSGEEPCLHCKPISL